MHAPPPQSHHPATPPAANGKNDTIPMQYKRIIFLIITGILIFGIYFNILDNAPTNWDDPALFENPFLHSLSMDNLKHVLALQPGSTYQPIRDLSYMLDFSLWKHNPVLGLHLHSILLYYFMIICAWMFLLELFKAFSIDDLRAFQWSCITAIIYAVHPVHVECVAWIYARKEPLLGIFTFLSLWSFIKARSGHYLHYLSSGIFLILAILSKPTALVIPAVMIVTDFALQAAKSDPIFWKKRLFIFVPMLILVIPMMARLVHMMSSIGGIKPYHGGSVWTNALAVSQILISYLSLIGATVYYAADYPIKLYTAWGMWQAWAFAVLNLLLIISAAEAYLRGRQIGQIYAIFVAWFYIFLLPVSHIFPISQTLADRYALIPSLSWCVGLGFVIIWLWHKPLHFWRFSEDFPKLISIALFSVIVLAYAYMTIRQNDVWQNSQILWEHTVARYPNSSPANVNLSVIYISQGRFQAAQDLCINAIKELPYDYYAISNLALAQMLMGQYDNAIHNYQQALKLKPDLFKARLGLANAYWEKKDMANTYNTYSEIVRSFGAIIETSYGPTVFLRLGYAAWKLGKQEEAQAYLEKASAHAGRFPPALKELVEIYTSMRNVR
jgi:tetratricopeptide (TPR) repeat protein